MTAGTKSEHRVVITIRPASDDDGRLTVDDALQQVLDILRVADDAQASLGRPHESFDWYLLSANTNSPPLTVVAVAEPANPSVDVTSHVMAVKQATASAVRRVAEGRPFPEWLTTSGTNALRDFFRRNANGVGATTIDLEGTDRIEVDHAQAAAAIPAMEGVTLISADVPARIAHGEIEGRLVSAGHYRNRPALYLITALYGPVWCVLDDHLIADWGDAQRVSDVWKGKRLIVFGRLVYWKGGKLSRIEAQNIREKEIATINIEDVLDPDFTAGLDPVEYLDRLHEGELG
jgi:hypothetical protein